MWRSWRRSCLPWSTGISRRRWPDGRPPRRGPPPRADRARGPRRRLPLPVRVDALDLAEADPGTLHAAADLLAGPPQPRRVPDGARRRAALGAPPQQPGRMPRGGRAGAGPRAHDRVPADPPWGAALVPPRPPLLAPQPPVPALDGGGDPDLRDGADRGIVRPAHGPRPDLHGVFAAVRRLDAEGLPRGGAAGGRGGGARGWGRPVAGVLPDPPPDAVPRPARRGGDHLRVELERVSVRADPHRDAPLADVLDRGVELRHRV